MEAVDELARVAVRILPGEVEESLRDRQRRAQLVGGVGREPLLFGDMGFEPRAWRRSCRQFAKLVSTAFNSIRWASDPIAALRVAFVMRVGERASVRRGTIPRRDRETSRNANAWAALGKGIRGSSERVGLEGPGAKRARSGT